MANTTIGGLSHDEFLNSLPAMPKTGRTRFAEELVVDLDDPTAALEVEHDHQGPEPQR